MRPEGVGSREEKRIAEDNRVAGEAGKRLAGRLRLNLLYAQVPGSCSARLSCNPGRPEIPNSSPAIRYSSL